MGHPKFELLPFLQTNGQRISCTVNGHGSEWGLEGFVVMEMCPPSRGVGSDCRSPTDVNTGGAIGYLY